MQVEEVQKQVTDVIPGATVLVDGADCSFSLTVVSDSFEGLSLLKKQQKVMAIFKEQIASGAMHAITVKTFTNSEWAAKA